MLSSPDHSLSSVRIPWVESPNFLTELAGRGLPAWIVDVGTRLSRDGLAVFDPGIENFDATAERIRAATGARYGRDGRLTNFWEENADVKRLALAPKILQLLETLYGEKVVPYQTLNFNVGTQQLTHSDSIHFQSIPARFMCGVWIALEDVDDNNGPLHYYPGSHRLPLITPDDLGFPPELTISERYSAYEKFLGDFIARSQLPRAELALKKGQAVIWAANVFHGGSPIKDARRTRHSQVTHYFFEGCRYYAPIQSRPFDGQVQFLHFKNIATGKKVTQADLPVLNLNRLTSRHRVKKLLAGLEKFFPPKSTPARPA